MLTLSESAAAVLAKSRDRQGIPDDAVLRVSGTPGDGQNQGFRVGFVTEPEQGDHTGSAHGLPICVAADVAATLEGAEIDARKTGDEVQLVIVPAS